MSDITSAARVSNTSEDARYFLDLAHKGSPDERKHALDRLGHIYDRNDFARLMAAHGLRYPAAEELTLPALPDVDWFVPACWKPNLPDDVVERLNESFGCVEDPIPSEAEEAKAAYHREYRRLLDEQARRRAEAMAAEIRAKHARELIEMKKDNRRADRVVRMMEKRQMTIEQVGNVLSYEAYKARQADAEGKFDPNFENKKIKLPVIDFITPERLDKKPVEEIPYLVQDWIVEGALNGLFGDGGVGKDLTLMQLAFAMGYDRKWLGMDVEQGRCLYINVEDPARPVLRWRQEKIKEHLGIKLREPTDRLRIVPMVGKQTILATFHHKTGLVLPTPLFESLRLMIEEYRPRLVIVGNRVNIFGVNQNDDAQARQCLGLLNSLITDFGTTVIMPGHVSVRGNQSGGDGTSGSVQWSNGVRQRLLLRRPTAKALGLTVPPSLLATDELIE
jgi:hypothetical protein